MPSSVQSPPPLLTSLALPLSRFADLKRGLTSVTDSEWENLPEVGNLTGKKQKRNPRFERDYAMPDSVTLGQMAQNSTEGSLTDAQMVRALVPRHMASSTRELTCSLPSLFSQAAGLDTPAATGTMTDLVEIGNARDKVLSLKLDQVRALISHTRVSRPLIVVCPPLRSLPATTRMAPRLPSTPRATSPTSTA